MLKKVEVSCPAKINLFLNVTGYNQEKKLHNVKMISQTIDLYDKVILQETKVKTGLVVKCNDVLLDENNNCFKIAKLFFDYTKINPDGFLITIEKNIPNKAGLSSDSTDSAGVLLGLNEYYHTNLTKRELIFLSSLIGPNVPYFIYSGCKYITECGERIENYNKSPYQSFLIIKPDFGISTKDMYSRLDETPLIEKSIPNNLLQNDFSRIMPTEIERLNAFLKQYQNLNYSLSGSGSSYFIASSEKNMKSSMGIALKREFPNYQLFNAKPNNGHKILVKYMSNKS